VVHARRGKPDTRQEGLGEYNLRVSLSINPRGPRHHQETINMTHGSLPAGHAIKPPMASTAAERERESFAGEKLSARRDEIASMQGIRQFE
jgi:hypothetical protein